jgi:hypothetical protein
VKTLRFLILLSILASCVAPNKSLTEARARERINSLDEEAQTQIQVLLAMIEERAQVTNAGEKRYIPYEFRMPLDHRAMKQVHRIDPTISFTRRSDAYQCIGENATKEKVFRIISLPYVYKLRFCPFE